MKRCVFPLVLVLVLAVLSPFFYSVGTDQGASGTKKKFVLPASLQVIEEDAFSGTAVESVVLPKGLAYIGEAAFANTEHLNEVYIPSSVQFIGKSAFSESSHVTVFGAEKSYAEEWAKEHQISFVPEDVFRFQYKNGEEIQNRAVLISRNNQTMLAAAKTKSNGRTLDNPPSMRPHDRPELNPIDYRFP